ncbi:SH3 domain-containing protein [Azovibrio restrictus]|jgi:SH3-like domain-containing protein|uniref:SH3 domain-containing protein n=1 Tax=Azovibrio restrictus TaxID=146938 RepID=UPI0026EB1403|nr:SH3 domain-containing protein [Azovibrio restrictus]
MLRRSILALCLGACLAGGAQAIEYRSVAVPVAVFHDAPSAQARKLFIVREGMPLEVLVQVEGWTKVRDAEGTIAWIERAALGNRRMLVVTADVAEIRQAPRAEAPLVFQAAKWVALELQEPPAQGWVRVRHRDGQAGFVRVTQVWGL